MSPDALKSEKPLLMLVPGISIELGQWARKIVINESVYRGSMLEYVSRAFKEGFNVIILNSNLNHVNRIPIRGSESPDAHVAYVWDNLIRRKSGLGPVLAVAHSYGGVCLYNLCQAFGRDGMNKLVGIALTDSVHSQAVLMQLNNYCWNVQFIFNSTGVPDSPRATEAKSSEEFPLIGSAIIRQWGHLSVSIRLE
ncbi:hypothetical protein HDU82_000656 [Entophlyctis luteolus]|nr:hypothetical protein HDU82_000656 [Entophlyctis luteolus]